MACLGAGVTKLEIHNHAHTLTHRCVHRSCWVLYMTQLYTFTKDPEGIGSNEDTGLEQGYHNKLSSVYVFYAVLIK